MLEAASRYIAAALPTARPNWRLLSRRRHTDVPGARTHKAAFHDTDILADILARIVATRMSVVVSVSWNASSSDGRLN